MRFGLAGAGGERRMEEVTDSDVMKTARKLVVGKGCASHSAENEIRGCRVMAVQTTRLRL